MFKEAEVFRPPEVGKWEEKIPIAPQPELQAQEVIKLQNESGNAVENAREQYEQRLLGIGFTRLVL